MVRVAEKFTRDGPSKKHRQRGVGKSCGHQFDEWPGTAIAKGSIPRLRKHNNEAALQR
jgi:hypothetical protein